MRRYRVLSVLALVGVLSLTATSCAYYQAATAAQEAGDPVPWWCTSTESIPVTEGPASGTVDWYAGVDKVDLPWPECRAMSAHFDLAKSYALQWPTAADAEADGWRKVTPYIPGMGTHHVRGGITPAMLASPTFDRHDPILDDVGLDGVFDPNQPDVLQYDGNGPSAKLVGFDYYVRTSTGLPPEGFAGPNDWWHHHPMICHRRTDASMIAFNVSDATCQGLNGVNVNLSNYYMLHVWVLDDMTFEPDVFAGMIPCITGGSAIHDPDHPCHTTRQFAGATDHATMDHRFVDEGP